VGYKLIGSTKAHGMRYAILSGATIV